MHATLRPLRISLSLPLSLSLSHTHTHTHRKTHTHSLAGHTGSELSAPPRIAVRHNALLCATTRCYVPRGLCSTEPTAYICGQASWCVTSWHGSSPRYKRDAQGLQPPDAAAPSVADGRCYTNTARGSRLCLEQLRPPEGASSDRHRRSHQSSRALWQGHYQNCHGFTSGATYLLVVGIRRKESMDSCGCVLRAREVRRMPGCLPHSQVVHRAQAKGLLPPCYNGGPPGRGRERAKRDLCRPTVVVDPPTPPRAQEERMQGPPPGALCKRGGSLWGRGARAASGAACCCTAHALGWRWAGQGALERRRRGASVRRVI